MGRVLFFTVDTSFLLRFPAFLSLAVIFLFGAPGQVFEGGRGL